MIRRMYLSLIVIAALLAAGNAAAGPGLALDNAVIVTSPQAPAPVTRASDMLRDEIQKRTGHSLGQQSAIPPRDGVPAVILGVADSMPAETPTPPAGIQIPQESEGYAIWVDSASRVAPTVYIAGRDARGALFGAGRLLRALHMKKGILSLDADLRVATAPRYPVRGHELGYRNKSNTYDAWTVDQYEQYIRDLAVFGANGVQLVVQLDSMDKDGPHMTEPVLDRTVKLAQLIGDYGLAVWIWLAPSEEAITAHTAPAVLDKCRAMFEQCTPIDAVFVPGGDPGGTPPDVLLPLLKEMAGILRASHPNAQMWVSNEDMPHEWNTALFQALATEQPDWLNGVVFGTWVKLPLDEMRAKIPAKYPIVQYADITHCIECQYPVHEWDRAFASTLGREPINPRPIATAQIHNAMAPFTIGFSSYSDGVTDDVNKIVWSAKGWDPNADLTGILKEYGRYFIHDDLGDEVAAGLLALEQNWHGPLLVNNGVEATLDLWRTIETEVGSDAAPNWRLQMGLYRAHYDAYIYRKLVAETHRAARAQEELARAREIGAAPAIANAAQILREADSQPDAPELRARIEQLGDDLFNSIGMQLSVAKYGASNWERGATLDALDMPLSDRPWFESQFQEILAMPEEPARMQRLTTMLNWEDAGPGGFYDDLGNPTRQPHLVSQNDWAADPGYVVSPQNEIIEVNGREEWRQSWRDQAQTLYGTPLRMRYEGLDPDAAYTLRVLYTGRFRPRMRLVANGIVEIHGPLPQPKDLAPIEFPIPKNATVGGALDLEWQLIEGRGCQVAETWLLRTDR